MNRILANYPTIARSSTAGANQETLNKLQTTISLRDDKIEHLVEKSERLAAEQYASQETIKKMKAEYSTFTDRIDFFKARAENLEYDMQELQTKLALAEGEKLR